MVGWQACGVRQCDRWHGCCKEDRGCRLSVRQDSQASGHCWLRLFVGPWALVDVANRRSFVLPADHLLSSSWGHLMTSDKWQVPNMKHQPIDSIDSIDCSANKKEYLVWQWLCSWLSMILLGWLCPSSLLISSSYVRIWSLAKLYLNTGSFNTRSRVSRAWNVVTMIPSLQRIPNPNFSKCRIFRSQGQTIHLSTKHSPSPLLSSFA